MAMDAQDPNEHTIDDIDRQISRRLHRNRFSAASMLFAQGLGLCFLLWYSGSEIVRCQRESTQVHCQIERTYWLGQTSMEPRSIANVSGIRAQVSYSADHVSETYFLQGDLEEMQLELIDEDGIQRLQDFLDPPTSTSITVERSTIDIFTDSVQILGWTILGLSIFMAMSLLILYNTLKQHPD